MLIIEFSLKEKSIDILNLIYYLIPSSFLLIFPFFFIFEFKFIQNWEFLFSRNENLFLISNGFHHFFLILFSFLMLKRTNSFKFHIFQNVFFMFLSIFLFSNFSSVNLFGYFTSFTGIIFLLSLNQQKMDKFSV
jgi:hypothetical protein